MAGYADIPTVTSSDIFAVSSRKAVISDAELDSAEAEIGAAFPAGYWEFMSELGPGTLSGYMDILSPEVVVFRLQSHRSLMAELPGLWSEGDSILSAEDRCRSICLAQSLDGDEWVYLPEDPEKIYLLPRDSDMIFVMGGGFWSAVAWFFYSGEYNVYHDNDRLFHEPANRRGYMSYSNRKSKREGLSTLSFKQFHEWLIARGGYDDLWQPGAVMPEERAPKMLAAGIITPDGFQPLPLEEPGELTALYRAFGGVLTGREEFGSGEVDVTITYDEGVDSPLLNEIVAHLKANGF